MLLWGNVPPPSKQPRNEKPTMNTKNITITTESGATFDFTVTVNHAWTEEVTVEREYGGKSITFTRAIFDLEITVPNRPNVPPFRTEYSAGSGCIPQTPRRKNRDWTQNGDDTRGDEQIARRNGVGFCWQEDFAADVALYNPGESVISCLCVDAQSVQNGETFAQWAEDMGETCIPVSEIADRMRAYTQCQETLQWLRWAVQTQDEGHGTRLQSLMEWANEQ